ncbi:MAG: helix-turn-helix domain-containing protein [Polyangiales bacterium]
MLSRREQGATYEQIAETLGVPPSTLHRWSREFGRETSDAATAPFRRVELVAAVPTMTLHGPCGLRVEGLDLDTLVALWRRLAS